MDHLQPQAPFVVGQSVPVPGEALPVAAVVGEAASAAIELLNAGDRAQAALANLNAFEAAQAAQGRAVSVPVGQNDVPLPMLTVDAILAAPDVKRKIVPVPEWGGQVEVQGLSLEAYQSIKDLATVGEGKDAKVDEPTLQANLLAACMLTPRVTIEQAHQLRRKSAIAVGKVLGGILEVLGVKPEAAKAAENSFRDGQGTDVPVQPGGTAEDAGGQA